MCLLGLLLILHPIQGFRSPQTPILDVWIGIFRPNMPIQTFKLSKLLHRSQPNFAQWWEHQVLFAGGPNVPQDGGRAPSCKIKKLQYLCNGLIGFHDIWHDDASWPSRVHHHSVKFRDFKYPRLWLATILKTKKSRYIKNSSDFSRIWCAVHNDSHTLSAVKKY